MAVAEAVLPVDRGAVRASGSAGWQTDEADSWRGEGPARWQVREAEPPGYGGEAGTGGGPRTCAGSDDAAPPAGERAPEERAPEEAEELEALGRKLVKWAAHQAAAEHRFLVRLAEFDRREGWKLTGDRNCADWLSRHARYDAHTAREKVKVAESLGKLPRISEAMSEGRLSYSQVRLLRRVATEACEEELLEVARHSTVKELERFVRSWPAGSRTDEDGMARQRRRSRRLAVFTDEGGMTRVVGRLTAEEGAMLEKALEAAEDILYGEAGWEEEPYDRRRADALALVAERVLQVGFGCRCGNEPSADEDARGARARAEAEAEAEDTATAEEAAPTEDGAPDPEAGPSHDVRSGARARPPEHVGAPGARAPGEPALASPSPAEPAPAPEPASASEPAPDCRTCGESAPAPLTGTRGERYQVFVHVDLDTLRRDGEPGRSELSDGTRLAPETARRLTCDAALVPVQKDEAGGILNVGRRRRAFPPALRRALEVRDGGCRFAALRAASRSHT